MPNPTAGVAQLDREIAALQAEDRAAARHPYLDRELSTYERLELLDHNLADFDFDCDADAEA